MRMDGGTASSVDAHVSATSADTTGRHRILADLKRVEQESNFLEEELEELDRAENVSAKCEELLQFIGTRPDPLLPVTTGPVNPIWDRWFEGPRDAPGCRCLIL